MKLQLLLGAALLAGTFAHAQTAKPTVAIRAGFNRATISSGDAPGLNHRSSLYAWHAGAVVNLPLSGPVSLQPGLLINSKGAQYRIGQGGTSNFTDVELQPMYLELPLNAVVTLPVTKQLRLFAGAGPYAAYGLGGKVKTSGRLLGSEFSKEEAVVFTEEGRADMSIGTPFQGNLKRFDLGLNLMAGVSMRQFSFSLGYGHGLTNIRPGNVSNGTRQQHRVASVSVGITL